MVVETDFDSTHQQVLGQPVSGNMVNHTYIHTHTHSIIMFQSSQNKLKKNWGGDVSLTDSKRSDLEVCEVELV